MQEYQIPNSLNLPNSDSFFSDAYNLAWQQILIWCAAAAGALITIWIIKSFINR
jgi:hypothetical protein